MKWSSAGKEIRDMTEVASELENMPELVIVSGMSGAGRTEAMHAFEDLGYFCVDNLPSALIGNLLALTGMPGQPDNHRRIAVVCDARSGGFFKSLMEELSKLKSAGVDYRVLFLDADDEKLIARYKSSRRCHRAELRGIRKRQSFRAPSDWRFCVEKSVNMWIVKNILDKPEKAAKILKAAEK